MPEILFTIQLPGGLTRQCYSPSTVVRDYFHEGDEMPPEEFLNRSRQALAAASERVRAKFGFSCSSAASELADIEAMVRKLPPEGTVKIIAI